MAEFAHSKRSSIVFVPNEEVVIPEQETVTFIKSVGGWAVETEKGSVEITVKGSSLITNLENLVKQVIIYEAKDVVK